MHQALPCGMGSHLLGRAGLCLGHPLSLVTSLSGAWGEDSHLGVAFGLLMLLSFPARPPARRPRAFL